MTQPTIHNLMKLHIKVSPHIDMKQFGRQLPKWNSPIFFLFEIMKMKL